MRTALFILITFITPLFSKIGTVFGQQQNLDSLFKLLKTDKQDTVKAMCLINIGLGYNDLGYYDSALKYQSLALELAKKSDPPWVRGIASAYNNLGNVYLNRGDNKKALEYYYPALEAFKKIGSKKFAANVLSNIGTVSLYQGNYSSALDNYYKALKIFEEIGNKKRAASTIGNIGQIYYGQKEYSKAMDNYQKALKILEKTEDKSAVGMILGTIGSIYLSEKKYETALDYYFRAVQKFEEADDKNGIQLNLSCIGATYALEAIDIPESNKNLRDSIFYKALYFDNKALKIAEELGLRSDVSVLYGNIGSILIHTKKYDKAEKYLLRALEICDSTGTLAYKKDFEEYISELYSLKGDHKKAFEHFKQYTLIKDSLFNEEKNQELTRHEMNYEFEKKEAGAKAEQEKKDAVTTAEKKKQQTVLILVSCVLILVFIFAGFIFRSLRVTKKQKILIEAKNKETEEQKQIIEEKQKEILDSINYAKRIQMALIPSEKQINQTLKKLKTHEGK